MDDDEDDEADEDEDDDKDDEADEDDCYPFLDWAYGVDLFSSFGWY